LIPRPFLYFKITKDIVMPLVQIKSVSGSLSRGQKAELIRKVTEAVLAVEGERLRPVTWVLVEDVPEGQWAVGGEIATTRMLRDMAARPARTP